jgi:hypothetical protein
MTTPLFYKKTNAVYQAIPFSSHDLQYLYEGSNNRVPVKHNQIQQTLVKYFLNHEMEVLYRKHVKVCATTTLTSSRL